MVKNFTRWQGLSLKEGRYFHFQRVNKDTEELLTELFAKEFEGDLTHNTWTLLRFFYILSCKTTGLIS